MNVADTATPSTNARMNPATGAAIAHAHPTRHTAAGRVRTMVENAPYHGATSAHARSTPSVVMTSRQVSSSVEWVRNPAAVIATGGLAEALAPDIPAIETVETVLTLRGLRILWERNRPR